MKKISDVQIIAAARQAGIMGAGTGPVTTNELRAFLKALDIPVEAVKGPFEKVPAANLSLGVAGVGAGARMG